MFDVNEALSIAQEEVANIVGYDNAQNFVNKCLGTEFVDCAESLKWYERHNCIYDVPKRGDQIFVGDSTGIVEMVVGNKVYTIEVNKDIHSSLYGLVCRNQRTVGDGIYCRPKYASKDNSKESHNHLETGRKGKRENI